ESEHLRDKSEEDESQVRSYILTCHREGKSVREIADLVNRSKTSVHRIIAREKNKEDVAPVEAVPPGDVGQVGHLGQLGQSEPVQVHGRPGIRDDLVFEMDENHCF
ncbi:MAG: helix-turn-helix domain-containing protein, partial [Bacteroidales bacterium]|nr:helix-turn-helix domain-containing protein [Bacteroidales bacterium]